MHRLLLKFGVHLAGSESNSHFDPQGPLFHRWLPDGETSAINLKGIENSSLKVWFERRGFVDPGPGIGFIEYDQARRDVDPSIMNRQGKLDAGPLSGLVEIEVTSEELTAIKGEKKNDDHYMALGKRIVNKVIVPRVSQFIKLLRTHYGQYWLQDLEAWDSRNLSLGGYCATLGLFWSDDGGTNWRHFRPTETIFSATLFSGGDFGQFLTQEDWEQIKKYANEGFEPSLAALSLSSAHGHLDKRNYRLALIDGVVALELAVNDLIRRRFDGSELLSKSISALMDLPLRTQIAALVQVAPQKVSVADLEGTIRAIESRNKVIHEAWDPDQRVRADVLALLKTAAFSIEGPAFKFPSCHSGNQLLPP